MNKYGSYLFNVTGLEFNGKAIDDIDIKFTVKSSMFFDSLSFTDSNGGAFDSLDDTAVTFKMMGYNDSKADECIFLALVQKDQNGLIKAVTTTGKIIKANGGSGELTDTLTLKDAVSTDNIEIFAWKDGIIMPYTEKIVFSLSEFDFTSPDDDEGLFFEEPIVLNNAITDVVCKEVDASIVVSGNSTQNTITFKIENSQGELMWLDQKNTDENGNFEFSCDMKAFSEGKNIITVHSKDL